MAAWFLEMGWCGTPVSFKVNDTRHKPRTNNPRPQKNKPKPKPCHPLNPTQTDPNGDETHNFYTLADQRGIMNEHTAVFELVLPSGAFNVSLLATMINTISQAAAMSKIVVVALWPGPLVGFNDLGPIWPGNTQPKSLEAWKPVMLFVKQAKIYHAPPAKNLTLTSLISTHRQKMVFAEAFYLTVATPFTYMQYELWYNGFSQGILPCDDTPSSCVAPDSKTWYPDLAKPLGPPLGPPVRTGNVWVRHFAHATSTLDLDNPDASSVVFSAP
jgi:hypothetical protein